MSEVAGKPGLGLALDSQDRAPTAVSPALAGQRNVSLQYLRAVAAISVLVYHGSTYLKELRGDSRFSAVFGDLFGAGGVAIFFALSGCLMAEIIRRDDWGKFLTARIARIYPPMLLMVALFALIFLVAGQPRAFNAIALTLVPAGPRGYFLGVEWTLLYEMTYYVALTLLGLLGLARWGEAFALVWLAMLGASWLWGTGAIDKATPTLTELPLLIANLPFVLGFLAFGAKRRGWLPRGLGVAGLALAGLVPLLPVEFLRLSVGIAASLLVAAMIRRPTPGAAGPAGRLGLRLGDASYVLYLCHVPVILLAAELLPASLPSSLVWLIWVGGALLVAMLLGPVDIALHGWLKRRIDDAPRWRQRAVALAYLAGFAGVAVNTEIETRADSAARQAASGIVASTQPRAWPRVAAIIDSTERLPNGRWVVRGYGIDLDRPELTTHIAILQRGETVMLEGMRRMRVATARELGRPDLESRRFGFSVVLPADFSCAKGPVDAIFVFEDGRVVPLAAGPLATICR